MKIINEMLWVLQAVKARIKISKIRLYRRDFVFSGAHLSHEREKIIDQHFDAIRKITKSKSLIELRSLIGLFNWQRHFIKDLSQKMVPLQQLVKQEVD